MNLNWGHGAYEFKLGAWGCESRVGAGGSESKLGPLDLSQKGRNLKSCKLKFSEARARSKDVFRGQGAPLRLSVFRGQGAFPRGFQRPGRVSEARARTP